MSDPVTWPGPARAVLLLGVLGWGVVCVVMLALGMRALAAAALLVTVMCLVAYAVIVVLWPPDDPDERTDR